MYFKNDLDKLKKKPGDNSLINKIKRTTHLIIAAHPDDAEIMAMPIILQSLIDTNIKVTLVVVTNGAGSAKGGDYANVSPDDLIKIRQVEQGRSDKLCKYNCVIMLNYNSSEAKTISQSIYDYLDFIFKLIDNPTVYTHNLLDKHETHIGVLLNVLNYLKVSKTPIKQLIGCEVWGSLDIISSKHKLLFYFSDPLKVVSKIIGVFKSQIVGGKRYKEATIGRWIANATYSESHSIDKYEYLSYALDMDFLLTSSSIDDINAFLDESLKVFSKNRSSLDELEDIIKLG